MRYRIAGFCLSLMLVCAADARAQKQKDPAEDIATQPARDVGVVKTKIAPVLREAAEAPYSLAGLSRCSAIAAAIAGLNQELGPDYAGGVDARSKRKVRITGDTVAGLIVPFRGIVREVSGAAPAQRELNAAIDAGIARRGFLRGVYETRRCRPAL